MVSGTTRVVTGGASFPREVGFATLSYPLVKASISQDGITISGRGLLRSPRLSTSFRWSELQRIDVAWKSIVLRGTGRHTCRFVTVTPGRVGPILDEARKNGVPIQKVSTTLRWYLEA